MQFDIEGWPLVVVEAGHTDTFNTTSLHVPDISLIVSGDVAYNRCHMFASATTPESRTEWVAALDLLAALRPTAVVTGHKDPTQAMCRPRLTSHENTSNSTENNGKRV